MDLVHVVVDILHGFFNRKIILKITKNLGMHIFIKTPLNFSKIIF
jgi:hypothetical protein